MASDPLTRLKLRLPEVQDEATLIDLLDEASDDILSYTRRRTLPPALTSTQVQLAVINYNRRGNEGEKQRTEGGISQGFDSLPENIRTKLVNYRLVKVGFS